MDHMLTLFAAHSRCDLDVVCDGDTYVDDHHTVEDVAICLGQAIDQALGEKRGITRYSSTIIPMDEALVLCAVDLCGRPYFVSDLSFNVPKLGDLDSEMIREFFYAVSYSAGMNLHFRELSGINNHHVAEAAFKAFAKALDAATRIDPRIAGVLSTKGALT